MYRKDIIWIHLFGLIGFLATGYILWSHSAPEWKQYQDEFKDHVAEKFGEAKASQIRTGLQQIWVKDLNRVDRCTTCHMGIEWIGLEGAPNPFKSHPKEILEKHPISKFGCSSCHGGQGYAVDTEAAHGFVEHWEEPLLGKELTDLYLIKDSRALMQMNCNNCHRYDRETNGAEFINEAKQLVQKKGCRACHTINGRGGVIGPDLTYAGSKSPEQQDYSRLSGVKSQFAWHVSHLQNPRMVVADSIMPIFNFNSREAQALSLLVMSWKQTELPPHYISGVQLGDIQTPEEKEKEQRMLTGEGAFFVKKGCFTCHSVSTLGIESATNIGPDLAEAVEDVQNRFGRTLDDFLKTPTGTMSVVLATQIQLTDAEKEEAIQKLKVAYQRHLQRKNQSNSRKTPPASPDGK